MMKKIICALCIATCFIACKKEQTLVDTPAKFQKISTTGVITDSVIKFRNLLGNSNNGAISGSMDSGRREINWDGVPTKFTNVDTFPPAFFNFNSARGLILQSSTNLFRVSNNDFEDLLPGYGSLFNTFSPLRTFSPVGTNIMTVNFRVPGNDTLAYVSGFGVVFCDVNNAECTTLEFFEYNKSIGIFKAPVSTTSSNLSFLGVKFFNKKVTSVRITTGNEVLGKPDGKQGGKGDVVVMDDFIFGEPKRL